MQEDTLVVGFKGGEEELLRRPAKGARALKRKKHKKWLQTTPLVSLQQEKLLGSSCTDAAAST